MDILNRYRRKIELVVISVLCFILFAPFSKKAFHIDSPVTVYVARRINTAPVNPSAGEYGKHLVLWNSTRIPESSVYHATPHPPLVPLYLSCFIRVFGERELFLNWAFFPFYLLSILVFYKLAGRIIPGYRFPASVIYALAPVVVVNSQNVMLDMPLAFFVSCSFYFLVKNESNLDPVWAGLFAGLACMTKFTGATLILTGPVYYLLTGEKKKLSAYLVPLFLITGIWILHDYYLWGCWQPLAHGHAGYCLGDIRYRFERMISFLGGTIVFPVVTVFLGLYIKKIRIITLLALVFLSIWSFLLYQVLGYTFFEACFYMVCACSGLVLIVISVILWSRKSNNRTVYKVFALHVLLHSAGGMFLTLYASRYMLPFVFVIVITFINMINMLREKKLRQALLIITIVSSAVVSILLSLSDYQYAEASKNLAENIKKEYLESDVFFAGRLGYLYYMYKNGFYNLLVDEKKPSPGDIIVDNYDTHDDDRAIRQAVKNAEKISVRKYKVFNLRTLGGRAGYYGSDRLPYEWIPPPSYRRFDLYRVKNNGRDDQP